MKVQIDVEISVDELEDDIRQTLKYNLTREVKQATKGILTDCLEREIRKHVVSAFHGGDIEELVHLSVKKRLELLYASDRL